MFISLGSGPEILRSCDPVKVTLDSANRKVALLTGRANIQDPKAKAALANGATVSVNQISPRVMQISIGDNLQNIVYPFPINSTGPKVVSLGNHLTLKLT
ncbi:hypothetical protein AX14_001438 [Amanita brunnescens Koide BX004]|nr:hypothetical protein AX14_001438 [Amanita brunnescens Koide BX004]